MKKKLSPKQKLFVQEYLIDLNATQAAIRAGYSKKTAEVIGHENLRKPYISSAIQKAMKKREDRTEITQDRVLEEYAKLAFFDPRKFFNDDGNLKNIVDLDDNTAACVAGVDVITISSKENYVEQIKKIKITDKKAALDSIAKHLGMFDKDKNNDNDKMIFNVNFGKKNNAY